MSVLKPDLSKDQDISGQTLISSVKTADISSASNIEIDFTQEYAQACPECNFAIPESSAAEASSGDIYRKFDGGQWSLCRLNDLGQEQCTSPVPVV